MNGDYSIEGAAGRIRWSLLNRRVYCLAMLRSWVRPEWGLTVTPVTFRKNDALVTGDDDVVLRERGIDGSILHTPDSLSVLLDDGRLFCGDAAMNRLRWAGTRYHTIYVAGLGQYFDSGRPIIDSGVHTAYPTHGDPFDVDRLREHLGAYDQDDLIGRDPFTEQYATFDGNDSNA